MRRVISLFVFLFLCFFNTQGKEKGILIEAEAFQHHGGWSLDQQFMDQMGSPYLIAHGLGKPVEDASTIIPIAEGGEYYVYVRTFNWTSPWCDGEGPGRFQVSVAGKTIPSVLGTVGKEWAWQKAGVVSIPQGDVEFCLHDLSGFDGRVDAIYLTSNPRALPPSHDKILVHKPSVVDTEYDLAVIGGGVAGMSAAAAAARLGLKVALVNNRGILGGNNSSEIRVHLGGTIDIEPYPLLGALQHEFGPQRGGNAQPASNYEDSLKMEWMKSERNVDLFLNYHCIAVRKKGKALQSVVLQNIKTGKQIQVKSRFYADCTGDGTLGFLSGAEWRMGREARSEYQESLAPEVADSITLGASVQWYSVKDEQEVPFPEFSYGISFDEKSAEHVAMGEWTWETGMNRNQISEFEQIRDYGMLVIYSNWSYLKNHSPWQDEYTHRKLGWVAFLAGKRESRRIVGDYVLSQNDLDSRIEQPDASFITTWHMDLHEPDPKNSAYFPHQEFKAITHSNPIYPYAVPYRCLYSRDIDNLFMAGRDISTTHVALGSTRVMRTCGMMGEVVGMAASLCCKYHVNPRSIYEKYLSELKLLMFEGVNKKDCPHTQNYNTSYFLNDK